MLDILVTLRLLILSASHVLLVLTFQFMLPHHAFRVLWVSTLRSQRHFSVLRVVQTHFLINLGRQHVWHVLRIRRLRSFPLNAAV